MDHNGWDSVLSYVIDFPEILYTIWWVQIIYTASQTISYALKFKCIFIKFLLVKFLIFNNGRIPNYLFNNKLV